MKISGICALAAIFIPLVFSGCSAYGWVEPETQFVVVDAPTRVPAGVIRYCWEEPMMQYEPQGPGIGHEGHWYHPAYMAVREVRMGRWRPCEPMPSEIKGETRNEQEEHY